MEQAWLRRAMVVRWSRLVIRVRVRVKVGADLETEGLKWGSCGEVVVSCEAQRRNVGGVGEFKDFQMIGGGGEMLVLCIGHRSVEVD